jgi:hypothetical protein
VTAATRYAAAGIRGPITQSTHASRGGRPSLPGTSNDQQKHWRCAARETPFRDSHAVWLARRRFAAPPTTTPGQQMRANEGPGVSKDAPPTPGNAPGQTDSQRNNSGASEHTPNRSGDGSAPGRQGSRRSEACPSWATPMCLVFRNSSRKVGGKLAPVKIEFLESCHRASKSGIQRRPLPARVPPGSASWLPVRSPDGRLALTSLPGVARLKCRLTSVFSELTSTNRLGPKGADATLEPICRPLQNRHVPKGSTPEVNARLEG